MSLRLNLTISYFIMPEKSFLFEIFTTPTYLINKGEIILTENYSHRLPWALMSIREDRVDILFCFLNKVSVSHGLEQLFLYCPLGCHRMLPSKSFSQFNNLSQPVSALDLRGTKPREEVNNLERQRSAHRE